MSESKYNMTDAPESAAQVFKQSPLFRTIYANTTKLAYTPWDVRISFSQLIDASQGSSIIEEEVCVVMSPQHAKVLVAMWQDTIHQYESKFGVVPDLREASKAFVPPDAVEPKQQKATKKRQTSNEL